MKFEQKLTIRKSLCDSPPMNQPGFSVWNYFFKGNGVGEAGDRCAVILSGDEDGGTLDMQWSPDQTEPGIISLHATLVVAES